MDTEHPVHSFFGLSYASYLVLPRVVMESMSLGWQQDMVRLLEEAGERFGHLYEANDYDVKLVAGERDENGEAVWTQVDPLADYRHQTLTEREKPAGKKSLRDIDFSDL